MNGIWIKRMLAAAVAVSLVVAAIVVRRAIDADDDAGAGSASTNPDSAAEAAGDGVVACLTELRAWCEQVDLGGAALRVEPWADTVASFASETPPGAWITFDPLPGLAAGYTAGEPVAGSALITVARAERSAAAIATCGTDAFWTCVGNSAGDSWTELGGDATWGSILIGVPDPTTSAEGLLALGAASTSFFGTNEYGSTEIDSTDEFSAWYSRFVRAVPAAATSAPLTLLIQRPSAVGIVSTLQVTYDSVAGGRAAEFPATYPGPMARADVVVAVRDESDGFGSLGARLGDVLVADGWDSATSGAEAFPSARTLVLLSGLWKEIRP